MFTLVSSMKRLTASALGRHPRMMTGFSPPSDLMTTAGFPFSSLITAIVGFPENTMSSRTIRTASAMA
jgi:hypothetical protein